MAVSNGKLEVDVEMKGQADKVWQVIRFSDVIFPRTFPELYESIKIVEGDGISVGSVRLVTYNEAVSPLVSFAKEKIEEVDDVKKTIVYNVVDGDLLKYYKNFKASLTVSPKGEESLVKWSCEFEKASADVPEPTFIKEFTITNFQLIDDLLKVK